MSAPEQRRYRFGPLERRSVIGSLRVTQVAVLAVSLGTGVVLMRTLASGAGVAAALVVVLAAAAFCFWPVAGRTSEEWLPVGLRYASRLLRGRTRSISREPQQGVVATDGDHARPTPELPAACADLELLTTYLGGEPVGVLKDRRQRTYTAALAVRVTSFGLLDRAE
ncbi:MAG: SCO6880 family protein, partial [Thermoleophilia bacterium]